jgi:hypothetical protein
MRWTGHLILGASDVGTTSAGAALRQSKFDAEFTAGTHYSRQAAIGLLSAARPMQPIQFVQAERTEHLGKRETEWQCLRLYGLDDARPARILSI